MFVERIGWFALSFVLALWLGGCGQAGEKGGDKEPTAGQRTLPQFTLMGKASTGVGFVNKIPENRYRNILSYQYYYNGGGVALADINGDGLTDILFSANAGPFRLYLNKGNLQFEDITVKSGIRIPGKASWNTGITMVDINHDGLPDFYACRSGKLQPENRTNLLFVNQGDNTFKESAREYGLDDPGYSIQAAFFDYDKDGDLDMYLANHGTNFYGRDEAGIQRKRDRFSGDKLYRNDQGKFTDVTATAGIFERGFSYGLGLATGDLNQDGWDDIYVSNDFFEHDYLFWNQGDGTFREGIKSATRQISYFGMGNDLSDINNDGLPDIVVLDMPAEDHYRKHTNLEGLSFEKFWKFVNDGYHYQYMYNSLNLNNGNGTFSNVVQLAGFPNTDWSWAPLTADFDNDGLKDIYITNGLRKDVLNLDFGSNIQARFAGALGPDGQLSDDQYLAMLASMPSRKINNYLFRNNGDLRFRNETKAWGLAIPSFSNGAAFGDLDNDGDLDLVVNNIDDAAFIFRNNQEQQTENHFLQIKLAGPAGNTYGLGTKVYVTAAGMTQYQQLYLTRGYQSAVEPMLHFGLGEAAKADTILIIWPDGRRTEKYSTVADQVITFDHQQAVKKETPPLTLNPVTSTLFREITDEVNLIHAHQENVYQDLKKQYLLPHDLSKFGPGLAVADVNADGLEDFYIGGAKGYSGTLYLQQQDGSFRQRVGPWSEDRNSEDLAALFFDANEDGAPDLYVVSGGNEFSPEDPWLADRLYLNEGEGQFVKSNDALPGIRASGSCVSAADIDGDGDQDLFVGGRLVPGSYPAPANSYILINEQGKFKDATQALLPALQKIGLVNAALWSDFDGDQQVDLILAGEWMPVLFFQNQNGKFVDVTAQTGLNDNNGWYFSLAEGDFDGDGDTDYLAGNFGLNSRFKASPESPLVVYAKDFDNNNSLDIVLGYYENNKLYPFHSRNALNDQMNFIKKSYPDYHSFAKATLHDIFTPEMLSGALHYQAKNFSSIYIENLGQGKFATRPLPVAAQISSVNDFLVKDFDRDGMLDIIISGNLYATEFRTARNDAGIGLFLKGDGKGEFKPSPVTKSGYFTPGDVKDLALVNYGENQAILVANNNDRLQLISVSKAMER